MLRVKSLPVKIYCVVLEWQSFKNKRPCSLVMSYNNNNNIFYIWELVLMIDVVVLGFIMPTAKGDSMRGLAVFISDIRNCKYWSLVAIILHFPRQYMQQNWLCQWVENNSCVYNWYSLLYNPVDLSVKMWLK